MLQVAEKMKGMYAENSAHCQSAGGFVHRLRSYTDVS